MIEFFIPCDPPKSLSKNSKQLFSRGGFVGMTDSKNTRSAKSTILQLFMEHAPNEPIQGALVLHIAVGFKFPESTPKKVKALECVPNTKRPDVDGIASGIMDCMTTLMFWNDDSQVSTLVVSKTSTTEPGIRVRLEVAS